MSTIHHVGLIKDGNELVHTAYNTFIHLDDKKDLPNVIYFAVKDIDGFQCFSYTLDKLDLIKHLAHTAMVTLGIQEDMPNSYDCGMASLMAKYASHIRGGYDVGGGYILTPQDMKVLLANDDRIQMWINQSLVNMGYAGASGKNAIPLIQQGLGTFEMPTRQDLGNCNLTFQDYVPDINDADPITGLLPVSSKEKSDSRLITGLAIGAAVAAGVGVVYLVKKGR